MASTSVLKVTITTGSAKIRSGEPHDEKGDMENQELLDTVFTGVLPVYTTYGEPIPGPYNKVELPGYLKEFVQDENTNAKETAETNAKIEIVPPKVRE